MRKLRAFWIRLKGLRSKSKADADFAAELETHLQMHTEENLRAGMTPGEARRQATIQLGGIEQTRQAYRERQTLPWLETLGQDVRFSLRMLQKSPGFTVIAIMTLALGIGANTAIFSIVNGVLLNPLPFPEPDRLMMLNQKEKNFEFASVSYPNFQDWRKDNRTFSAMAISRGYYFSLIGSGTPEQLDGQFISDGYFDTLGVKPLFGRTFTASENLPGAAPVTLISEGLWRRKFDGSANVLGKSISLEGRSYSIIGVIPASFNLSAARISSRDIYVPIGQWRNTELQNRGNGMGLRVIARLRPTTSIEQARADMSEVSGNLASAYPDSDTAVGVTVIPLKERVVGEVRPFLLLLMAAVGFVLLLACVNVASLMLARSTSRMREFAIRTALGASRRRMIRQLLTESLLLSITAGALGLVLALWGLHAGLKLLPDSLPRANEIGLDPRVLLFTTAVSLLAGILFGLVPALKSSRIDPQTALKEGGRGVSGSRHRAQSVFVIAEMALALLLLVGAGLMLRSLQRLWSVDPGFNPKNALTFGYTLPPSMINANPEAIRAAYRNFDDRLATVPGVEAVSQSWGAMPMDSDSEATFWLDGKPRPATTDAMNSTLAYIVGPEYLRVMGITLLKGRFLEATDNANTATVGVIDDLFAKKYFPGQDPIGKIIVTDGNPVRKIEIVGIVGHTRQWGLVDDDAQPLRVQLYTAWMQSPDDFTKLAPSGIDEVVRYKGDLDSVSVAIRSPIGQISNQQIIYDFTTIESIVSDTLASRRFVMIMLAAFAVLALLLASIGIYGVIAYIVGQRTQEIGIRMALGAHRSDVLRLMLWEGMRLALIGVGIGVAAGLALTQLMSKMLYGVSATDPLTFCGVAALLTSVALAACYFPARKAARTDPMQALRSE
jgi:predicted permease